MSLNRVAIPSPNYSSRGGTAVRLIVLHTAEGAVGPGAYQSLGAYFQNPASGVSSHVGIDDTPNEIGEYVPAVSGKAWTQGNANPYSVAAELCAYAKWTPSDWAAHPVMLSNAGAWVAEEAARFGIPIVALTAAQAQDGHTAGVCQHADLGAAGGGHWDCGSGFPMADVIAMAAGGARPGPAPSTETDNNMVLTDQATGGIWVADATGAVYSYDKAPYLGGTNNTKANAGGYPCVGIGDYTDSKGPGYVLVLDWGDADGDGHSADGGDRYRRYRFSRDGSGRS